MCVCCWLHDSTWYLRSQPSPRQAYIITNTKRQITHHVVATYACMAKPPTHKHLATIVNRKNETMPPGTNSPNEL